MEHWGVNLPFLSYRNISPISFLARWRRWDLRWLKRVRKYSSLYFCTLYLSYAGLQGTYFDVTCCHTVAHTKTFRVGLISQEYVVEVCSDYSPCSYFPPTAFFFASPTHSHRLIGHPPSHILSQLWGLDPMWGHLKFLGLTEYLF